MANQALGKALELNSHSTQELNVYPLYNWEDAEFFKIDVSFNFHDAC